MGFADRPINNTRPTKCCEIGTYQCDVPMAINGRVRGIDYCIADIVAALNAAGIATNCSCCGHGKLEAIIYLDDGREIVIKNAVRPWETQP